MDFFLHFIFSWEQHKTLVSRLVGDIKGDSATTSKLVVGDRLAADILLMSTTSCAGD